MAPAGSNVPLQQSLIARLLDDEPETAGRSSPQGRQKSRTQEAKEFRETVRRELQMLLNSRQPCVVWPDTFSELDVSLVNYGIPDFTGYDLSSNDRREEFRRHLEKVIRSFEPRLVAVTVSLVGIDEMTRSVRFRISALIQTDSTPETLIFDSVVDPGTRALSVVGDGGG